MFGDRASGILMPIFSLPSREGIGVLGKSAYEFIDFLVETKQSYWQILPIGVTSYGDSPYQNFSSFAGNPYFIDLQEFVDSGWLTEEEVFYQDWGDPSSIRYDILWDKKYDLLRKAYNNHTYSVEEIVKFQAESFWLEDYALFMALKTYFHGKSHFEWPEARLKSKLSDELKQKILVEKEFHIFIQFVFFKQWGELKNYANKMGISIIGDIPIFVAADSVDVWAEPEYFLLDDEGIPTAVAGVPPDYFSQTGQLWGNPLYNWDAMERDNFSWWINRLRETIKLFDIIRIDHFRGFESYWKIPYGAEHAVEGKWEQAPGEKLFDTVKQTLGNIPIIAEDLGIITDKVRHLIEETGFQGMKVLLFAFDDDPQNLYKPANYTENYIVYTGTHDNETVVGWSTNEKNRHELENALKYWHADSHADIAKKFLEGAFYSRANTAIIPIQDLLELGNEARINTPATLGNNWKWRLSSMPNDEIKTYLRELTIRSKRI